MLQLPQDLYIPPDALEVFLEAFEGPLDLLLYLINKQNFDILDIPIAAITEQYMEYVELMKEFRLSLAGDYLVMAATLAEIKSRLLLPRLSEMHTEEEDPRAELIRRLQEYERFKQAAEDLDRLKRLDRDNFTIQVEAPPMDKIKSQPDLQLAELLAAVKEVFKRADLNTSHQVQREPLSIRERMSHIMEYLKEKPLVQFSSLFTYEEGRMGVVVCFIAILELLRQTLIEIIQNEAFSPIHIKAINS